MFEILEGSGRVGFLVFNFKRQDASVRLRTIHTKTYMYLGIH